MHQHPIPYHLAESGKKLKGKIEADEARVLEAEEREIADVVPGTGPPERIKLVEFYDSAIGQELYADRKTSIEPLFETFKDTLGIRTVPIRGSCNVKSFVLICVLAYSWQRIAIGMIGAENPRTVKRVPCC